MKITVDVTNLQSDDEIRAAVIKRIEEIPNDEFVKLTKSTIYSVDNIIERAIKDKAERIIDEVVRSYGEASISKLVTDLLMVDIIKPALDSMAQDGKYSKPVVESLCDDIFPRLFVNELSDYIRNSLLASEARKTENMAEYVRSKIESRYY